MSQKSKGISMFTTVNFGQFQGKIVFSCGFTVKELIKHFKKQDCHDWASGLKSIDLGNHTLGIACKRTYKKTQLFYLILRDPFKFTDQEYCTLAHEVLHLVQFRLIDILDRDQETECEAYLHTHIMQQILSALRGEVSV